MDGVHAALFADLLSSYGTFNAIVAVIKNFMLNLLRYFTRTSCAMLMRDLLSLESPGFIVRFFC